MEESNDLANQDLKALESLVVDNPDLDRLEELLDQFNIFEALGAVKVELRHSDFLAYLLSPNQNHGLGDSFVKEFLQKALSRSPGSESPITPIELDLLDLDNLLVLREWQNIDILLLDESNSLVVIIENKIESGEHSDQLRRYYKIVSDHYPNLRTLAMFLTPDGDDPSDPEYFSVDYGVITQIVEKFVDAKASTLGPDVLTLMRHYGQMLRRHIVNESEIAELSKQIYRKHQRALDIIYEYRPDQQSDIKQILESLIDENPSLTLDHTTKSSIRFSVPEFDSPLLLQGEGWTASNRIMLFEFGNYSDRLGLYLVIGPGPEDLRKKLFNMAHSNKPPFNPAFKVLGKSYNTIYKRSFLTSKSYEGATTDDLEAEIQKKWESFIEKDLPDLREVISNETWIREGDLTL